MSVRRIVGLALVIAGTVVLFRGGVFWTERDKIVDAGPIEVTRSQREGVKVPPLVGGTVLVGGIVLVILPDRRARKI